MEGSIIGAIHTMNRAVVAVVAIILIGHQWMAAAIVAVLSMGVVEAEVGLVLDGAIIGETAPTTQMMNAGTVEPMFDGLYLVLVGGYNIYIILY